MGQMLTFLDNFKCNGCFHRGAGLGALPLSLGQLDQKEVERFLAAPIFSFLEHSQYIWNRICYLDAGCCHNQIPKHIASAL